MEQSAQLELFNHHEYYRCWYCNDLSEELKTYWGGLKGEDAMVPICERCHYDMY